MPLGAYIRGFPAPARLHPVERALLELTVGAGTYERVLARVDALRRSTVEVRSRGRAAAGGAYAGMRLARAAAGMHGQSWCAVRACIALLAQRSLPTAAAAACPRSAGGQGVHHTRLSCRQQEGRAGAAGGGAAAPAGGVQPRQLRKCAAGVPGGCGCMCREARVCRGCMQVVCEAICSISVSPLLTLVGRHAHLLALLCTMLPHAVDELKHVAKSVRRLPVVEPELPTVRTLLPPAAVLAAVVLLGRSRQQPMSSSLQ